MSIYQALKNLYSFIRISVDKVLKIPGSDAEAVERNIKWDEDTFQIFNGTEWVDLSGEPLVTGTADQYIKGDHTLGFFSDDVIEEATGVFSPIGHTHEAIDITDLTVAVRNMFTEGTGITYNPFTGVIAAEEGGEGGIIDAVPTNGSSNAVSSNGVYDELADKQNLITLTTTGTSGAATFNPTTGALNIPVYSSGGTADGNNYPTSFSFNTTTKILTLNRNGLSAITVDLSSLSDSVGASALDDLTDVTISSPSNGQIIKRVGGVWVNAAESGATNLDGLSDVIISSPSTNQVLKYNGTNWANGTDDSGGSGGTSGTWAPTLTNVANTATLLAEGGIYTRIGNIVTASVMITCTPTGLGGNEVGFTLPVASNFSATYELIGVGNPSPAGDNAAIAADTTNDRARLIFAATSGTARSYRINFQYQVI